MHILTEPVKQSWAPRTTLNVIVRNGIAELWGVILDEREREAMRVVAENAPGIKAVSDHLACVEPMSGMVVESPEDALADRQQGLRGFHGG